MKSERVKSEKSYIAYKAHEANRPHRAYRTCGLFLLLFAFALGACDRPVLYDYQAVSSEGWLSTDTLRYQLEEIPHDGWYSFSLGLRYTNALPYQDVWLVLERRQGDHFRRRDTLHMTALQDSLSWQANGPILHEREEVVSASRLTAQQMPVLLLVYHIMQRQRLTGISDVGVKVE